MAPGAPLLQPKLTLCCTLRADSAKPHSTGEKNEVSTLADRAFSQMSKLVIPRKTVYRLSLYQRALQRLKTNKIETVSSAALAKAAGVKPTQLRKDLTYFGQFGTRGLGYSVEALSGKLTEVLGTTHLQPVILVGAGHLGSALLRYPGFAKEGFEVVAAFDLEPSRARSRDLGVKVLPMAKMTEFVREQRTKMAILTVPAH